MIPLNMGKRTAKVPLALISPNEAVYKTRSKSGGASISGQYEGKENTPVRSSRRGTLNAAADEEQMEQLQTSRSSNKRLQTSVSQKRARSSVLANPSSRSGLPGGDQGLRGEEDCIVGSQTSAPVLVRKDENFLPDDKKRTTKNLEYTATANDDCSQSSNGSMSDRAPIGTAVQHDRNISGSLNERLVACSLQEQTVVPVEVAAATNMALVPIVHLSPTDSTGEHSSGKKRASIKTYRRRASIISPCAPNTRDVVGTSKNGLKHPGRRDKNHGIESTDVCKSNDLQGRIAGATDSLQNAYDKLYKKYQNLKKRQLADVDGAFDEQSERIKAFTTAADDYVETLKTTNSAWQYQEEMISRSRLMEAAYIECQNNLVIERARNLELRQQLENAELSGSKLPENTEPCGSKLPENTSPRGSKLPEDTEPCGSKLPENTELCGSKLLQELLQSALQLTISNYGKSDVMLSHDESGYEFKLEQNKLSEEVGGKDALLYNVVSLGTILHVAPEWMRSEIVFDMAQVRVFFRRILAVVRCGGVSV